MQCCPGPVGHTKTPCRHCLQPNSLKHNQCCPGSAERKKTPHRHYLQSNGLKHDQCCSGPAERKKSPHRHCQKLSNSTAGKHNQRCPRPEEQKSPHPHCLYPTGQRHSQCCCNPGDRANTPCRLPSPAIHQSLRPPIRHHHYRHKCEPQRTKRRRSDWSESPQVPANHTTKTNATTSASRNALRGAVQTDQQHNLHQRSLRQPNYHHRCCRRRQLQHNRRLSKAPQAPLLNSPTNTTHQATQHTQRHRPDRPQAPQEPQSLRPPICQNRCQAAGVNFISPADADQEHRTCQWSLRQQKTTTTTAATRVNHNAPTYAD